MAKKLSTTRKGFAIGLAVVGIAGLSLASAAQLNLTSSTLGASNSVVASCQPTPGTAITAGFTTAFVPGVAATSAPNKAALPARYDVAKVTLTNVASACNNLNVTVNLLNESGASIGVTSATASTGSTQLIVPSGTSAELVTSIAVVIAS